MPLVLFSLALLLVSSALSLSFSGSPARARAFGVIGAVGAALAGLPAAAGVLFSGRAETLSLPWPVPMGSLSLSLDPLAAFFLVPLFLLTGLAAVYGAGYMERYEASGRAAPAWAQFNLLTASMALVLLAANAVLFMTGWELMALSSFLLVLFEGEKKQARRAGFIYLAVGAGGALLLLAAFGLLAAPSGSLDFSSFLRPTGARAAAVFLIALTGFGLKAGFMPLHVWLPEAHPAAPSHVSAVMSGVMIKMGVYGLLRTLGFLAPWPEWWGALVLVLGAVSALGGVLFALAQHDLKRLLAYSSIENIGIILLGLGLGMIGLSRGSAALAALGLAGALLNAFNHSLFKGLLFMGAGAVIHSAGLGELEALGGLSKKMPRTSACFLAGSASITALPPFNGFVGEFLIYLAAFRALLDGRATAHWGAAALLALAAAGALAGGCFAKAFGSVFLGEPRSTKCSAAHDPGAPMLAAMYALAAACLAAGLLSPFLLLPLANAADAAFPGAGAALYALAALPVAFVSAGFSALCGLLALAAALRAWLMCRRGYAEGPTWDCGYARPTARMQYGASSFSQPLTDFFQPLLRSLGREPEIRGYFPSGASFSTEAQALVYNKIYSPAAHRVRELAYRFTWLQHGRLQIYILYIVLTLLALLLWKL